MNMNEYLQTLIITTVLAALLATVADDFYLRRKPTQGISDQEWLRHRKKRKRFEKEWENGEIVEDLIIRVLQELLVFPILILLYKAELEPSLLARDWIIGFVIIMFGITAMFCYRNSIILGIQLVGALILTKLLHTPVVGYVVGGIIFVAYILFLSDIYYGKIEKIKPLKSIIRKIIIFELSINIEVIKFYLVLYILIPQCKFNLIIRAATIIVIVQLFIPIRRVWKDVL